MITNIILKLNLRWLFTNKLKTKNGMLPMKVFKSDNNE